MGSDKFVYQTIYYYVSYVKQISWEFQIIYQAIMGVQFLFYPCFVFLYILALYCRGSRFWNHFSSRVWCFGCGRRLWMEVYSGTHNVISFTTALTYRHAGFRDQATILDATQLPTAAFNFLGIKNTDFKVKIISFLSP